MTVAEEMGGKLRAAFSPDELEIIDESHLHRGHAGAPEGGESHFRVRIVSVAFAGMSRLDRQRAVHQVLREELAGPVHALSVVADAPAAV